MTQEQSQSNNVAHTGGQGNASGESNPSRQAQANQARQSPLKKPETETAHANAADVDRAAQEHQQGPRPSQQADSASAGQSAGDVTRQRANSNKQSEFPEDVVPRGADVRNDDSSDSTVDTDGKGDDARRLERLNDREIVSNASPDNAAATPPEGLAGIDSRPGGNRAGIAAKEGSRVVEEGFFESQRLYETAGDDSDAEQVAKKADHVPPNHSRIAQKIRIDSKG